MVEKSPLNYLLFAQFPYFCFHSLSMSALLICYMKVKLDVLRWLRSSFKSKSYLSESAALSEIFCPLFSVFFSPIIF